MPVGAWELTTVVLAGVVIIGVVWEHLIKKK
jgi:hypothetical protein